MSELVQAIELAKTAAEKKMNRGDAAMRTAVGGATLGAGLGALGGLGYAAYGMRPSAAAGLALGGAALGATSGATSNYINDMITGAGAGTDIDAEPSDFAANVSERNALVGAGIGGATGAGLGAYALHQAHQMNNASIIDRAYNAIKNKIRPASTAKKLKVLGTKAGLVGGLAALGAAGMGAGSYISSYPSAHIGQSIMRKEAAEGYSQADIDAYYGNY